MRCRPVCRPACSALDLEVVVRLVAAAAFLAPASVLGHMRKAAHTKTKMQKLRKHQGEIGEVTEETFEKILSTLLFFLDDSSKHGV